jgi:hypothetical protein
MAKRRSYVPECPASASLEGRVVLSSIGDWFTSQYNHIKEDLGITHKHSANAAAGIEQLWKDSAKLSKPTPAASHHQAAAHQAAANQSPLVRMK